MWFCLLGCSGASVQFLFFAKHKLSWVLFSPFQCLKSNQLLCKNNPDNRCQSTVVSSSSGHLHIFPQDIFSWVFHWAWTHPSSTLSIVFFLTCENKHFRCWAVLKATSVHCFHQFKYKKCICNHLYIRINPTAVLISFLKASIGRLINFFYILKFLGRFCFFSGFRENWVGRNRACSRQFNWSGQSEFVKFVFKTNQHWNLLKEIVYMLIIPLFCYALFAFK